MKNLLLPFLVCIPFVLDAQGDCVGSFNPYFLNSNHIRASFYPRGNKYRDGNNPGFLAPFPAEQELSTIYASSIWISSFDDAGNLKQAAETWPSSSQTDFSVGPLTSIGLPYDSVCGHYDQAWTVNYEDIQAYRLDFLSDFKVDDTIPSIFGWPGRGNKFFKSYYGFELPNDNQGLAAFFDWNGNNIYDPDEGDYPIVRLSGKEYIPDQILWMVFNDVDPADSTGPGPLHFEIQLTAFAFHCQDNELLNNTIFNSYKIINRANIALDSAFFGVWTDYDLGCGGDDFMGSDSARNTEFVYNALPEDNMHNVCFEEVPTYPGIPPIQSMTYLNQPMHSFIQYDVINPTPVEKYRLLNGMWSDGKLIRQGGDGHFVPTSLSPTKFLFNGDPRDTSSWSAINALDYGTDQRSVSSVSLGRMDPGAVRVIETAYNYNYDPLGGHLDQITKMYNNVDSLMATLATLDHHCNLFPTCQEPDCIWPGDFDHNGIADHRDYLFWGVFKSLSGPSRDGLVSWRGQPGADWNEVKAGINAKYGDGDGNGVINQHDIDINTLNFLQNNKYYDDVPQYPPGTDIVLKSNAVITDQGQIRNFRINAGHELQHILGLAFEVEYDTSHFELQNLFDRWPEDSLRLIYSSIFPSSDYAKVAFIQTEHTELTIDSLYSFCFGLGTIFDLKPGLPVPDSTIIRLRNLIAIDQDGNDLHLGSNPLVIYKEGISGTSDLHKNEVNIYPNPASNSISIETELESGGNIINLQGHVVKKIPASDIHKPVDISSLSPGFYILQMLETGQTFKFIKR